MKIYYKVDKGFIDRGSYISYENPSSLFTDWKDCLREYEFIKDMCVLENNEYVEMQTFKEEKGERFDFEVIQQLSNIDVARYMCIFENQKPAWEYEELQFIAKRFLQKEDLQEICSYISGAKTLYNRASQQYYIEINN